jgi:DNA primase
VSLFTPETIERVRESADIVEVVSAHTDLRRQGERFVGLCPFHEERTPSFSVKPAEGFYYCFGCEAGGDTIKFVQEKEGLSFPDAVEMLADRYGVEVEREQEDPQAEQRRRRRARLGEALERAAAFYEATLWETEKAAKPRAYLLGRGLREETLRAFGVGFAPSAWDSIVVAGQRAGFSIDELHAVGLVQKGRKGGYYDAFRARITFPVRDARGRTVGFGARATTPDQKPKYKNSTEGELYHKSRTLYGIDRARGPIARSGRAVVVEGYTDVLALHQVGIEETVAVMGTAITSDQLKLLSGYAGEVVLALDADRAGREAMLRAQRVSGAGKLRLLVCAMPEGEDPAEMLAEERGEERFRTLLAEAVDLPVFHARAILADGDLSTPAGRDRALDEVVPVLAAMGETITRQELISEIADALDTNPGMIARRLAGARPAASARAQTSERRPPREVAGDGGDPGPEWSGGGEAGGGGDPGPEREAEIGRRPTVEERREDAFLAMCIASPGTGAEYLKRVTPDHLVGERARLAQPWLAEHLRDPLEELPRENEDLFAEISRLTMLAEREPAEESAIELSWLMLERARIDRQIARLRREGVEQSEQTVELHRERARISDAIATRSA